MPREKDLKRLVRARMRKTGEAYTTARVHILARSAKTKTRASAAVAPAPARDFAALAGISDAAVKEKTGCTWERWVRALDRHGAAELPHREIARLVSEQYKVQDWWAQTVTVGYERIKGLRARGQRRDGTYEANKSRTLNVPIDALYRACADARARRKWLPEPGVKLRTAAAGKSIRFGWPDGSVVVLGFLSRGDAKSAVAVQHTKLRDPATADRLKQYWSERLDALGRIVAPNLR